MKKLYDKTLKLVILSCFLFLCPFVVNASGNASTGFSGNSSVYLGNTIDITLYVGGVSGTTDNGGLAAFGGNLNYDSDKLELVGTSSLAPFTVELVGNKFGGFGANTIKGYSNIMKFTFRAKALGSANISYTGSSQPDASASPVSISGCSKTINITNPPSSNNNLASLSISNGSISFNKDNTSYNVTVDSDVTNITVNAQAEDSGASVSGTGSKSLNYGNNAIRITVKAPSGDQKTYTINVNRKDSRSSNNKLSSLTVNSGTLEPSFSADREEYNLSVPYSVSSLKVSAKAEDSKAKISITGQNDLVAEETRDVKIHVTAENGSVKTYTIHVSRGKDPNKVLSTNNYLASLNISVGILSPEFNKEKEIYVVYLPFEVDTINIEATVEDTKYAILKKEGPDKLSVGNNEYLLKVTAEDESVRTYKIIVVRAASIEEASNTSNTYLKKLNLENGKLKGSFNKKVFIYTYKKTKKDALKVEAIPEDENSNVSILNVEDIYVITVESATGEKAVYVLQPEEANILSIILIIVATVSTITSLVIGYILGKKNISFKKQKPKKTSKKNKKKKEVEKE